MKSIYILSTAIFCLALGPVLTTAGMPLMKDALPGIVSVLCGGVLLIIGLRTAVGDSSEKDAAMKETLERQAAALAEAVNVLRSLKEPLNELKLTIESQEQNETVRHGELMKQLAQSKNSYEQSLDRLNELIDQNKNNADELRALRSESTEHAEKTIGALVSQDRNAATRHGDFIKYQEQLTELLKKLMGESKNNREAIVSELSALCLKWSEQADKVTDAVRNSDENGSAKLLQIVDLIKDMNKNRLGAIYSELSDLRSVVDKASEQELENLEQIASHAEDIADSLQNIRGKQKETDRKLFEELENIGDMMEQNISGLKTAVEIQNETNRNTLAQIMGTYSSLTKQDIELLDKILEQYNA